MKKNVLQDYCLQMMGITQWKLRAELNELKTSTLSSELKTSTSSSTELNTELKTATSKQVRYFLFILAPNGLPLENQQLIGRLLDALNWPVHCVQQERLLSTAQAKEMLQRVSKVNSPLKAVLFDLTLGQALGFNAFGTFELRDNNQWVAVIPSLTQLLEDRLAKKQAWEILQPFKIAK